MGPSHPTKKKKSEGKKSTTIKQTVSHSLSRERVARGQKQGLDDILKPSKRLIVLGLRHDLTAWGALIQEKLP
jgi:hypothetical protein